MADLVQKVEGVITDGERVVADVQKGDLISALSDVKSADEVKDVVVSTAVQEVDGKSFGCMCGGWHLAVQMTQVPKAPVLPKLAVPSSIDSTSIAPSAPPSV